jgi:hypothetical protein
MNKKYKTKGKKFQNPLPQGTLTPVGKVGVGSCTNDDNDFN